MAAGLQFYSARGQLTVEKDRVGRVIESPSRRPIGSRLAARGITPGHAHRHRLVLSLGKGVLLPLIGCSLFRGLPPSAKNLHDFISPVLIIAVPFLFNCVFCP